jgi:regulatory protein
VKPRPTDDKVLYAKAIKYCAAAERNTLAVRRKLIAWGCPKTHVPILMAKLTSEGWVDDHRFARLYVRSKVMLAWGRIKLRYMLGQQGVSFEAINRALEEEIEEATYERQLLKLIRAKRGELLKEEEPNWRDKLYRFLSGRGYSVEEIQQALSHEDVKHE